MTTTDTRIEPPDAKRTDRSISAAWQRVTCAPISDAVLEWPPDLFALTDVVLHRSEAYRLRSHARHLARFAPRIGPPRSSPSAVVGGDVRIPELVAAEWRVVRERSSTPLEDLADGSDERLLDALITLHAIADEACAGLGSVLDAPDDRGCRYRGRARELMVSTGSLARVPPDRPRVLPKARTPRGWGLGRGALAVCLRAADERRRPLAQAPDASPRDEPGRSRVGAAGRSERDAQRAS
jgi:hypothetical protein